MNIPLFSAEITLQEKKYQYLPINPVGFLYGERTLYPQMRLAESGDGGVPTTCDCWPCGDGGTCCICTP